MAKMVFDSSERKRAKRQQELESHLAKMAETERSKEVEKPMAKTSKKSSSHPTESAPAEKTSSAPHETKGGRSPEDYSQVLRDEGRTGAVHGVFASFIPQPETMTFENQQEREKILLVLRQHPIVNVGWIAVTVAMIVLPHLLGFVIPFQTVFPGFLSFFATLGWGMIIASFVIESFLHWYFNLYIITDERIVDVDFYSIIYKEISEAKLDRIEDVTATTAGFLGAVFNYGSISIQTAAEKRQFEFARVPQPAKITKFLNELILEEEREKVEGRVM